MRRVQELDGLRAIAVTAVILYHSAPASLVPGGFLGVDLFFVLSAFLISGVLENQSLKTFYVRRFLRLTPALYLMLLTGLLLAPDYSHLRDFIVAGWRMALFRQTQDQRAYGAFRSASFRCVPVRGANAASLHLAPARRNCLRYHHWLGVSEPLRDPEFSPVHRNWEIILRHVSLELPDCLFNSRSVRLLANPHNQLFCVLRPRTDFMAYGGSTRAEVAR